MPDSRPTVQEVREELGSPSAEDISDLTLQRLIDEEKTLYGAAYRAAEILARKYAMKVDLAVGDYRESFSDIAKRWQEIAESLRRRAVLAGKPPYAGGISVEDQTMRKLDPDRPKPDFWRGMWDNRG